MELVAVQYEMWYDRNTIWPPRCLAQGPVSAKRRVNAFIEKRPNRSDGWKPCGSEGLMHPREDCRCDAESDPFSSLL